MKKTFIFILSFFILINTVNASELQSVTLSKCVDGDTAEFVLDGETLKFRFLAIDTPESVHPTKAVEAFGKEASEYTCNRLTNSQIQIEYDEKGNKTDKYGRHLAWIYVDESLLQKELVEKGLAEVSYVYYKYSKVSMLCDVQKEAVSNKVGIWSLDRKEGYCSTGSNKTSDNKTTTTVVSSTKEVTSTEDEEKILKYIKNGNYEKAIALILKNNNIYMIIFFSILLVLSYIYKNKKKKR